jgi:hypothetical protein
MGRPKVARREQASRTRAASESPATGSLGIASHAGRFALRSERIQQRAPGHAGRNEQWAGPLGYWIPGGIARRTPDRRGRTWPPDRRPARGGGWLDVRSRAPDRHDAGTIQAGRGRSLGSRRSPCPDAHGWIFFFCVFSIRSKQKAGDRIWLHRC